MTLYFDFNNNMLLLFSNYSKWIIYRSPFRSCSSNIHNENIAIAGTMNDGSIRFASSNNDCIQFQWFFFHIQCSEKGNNENTWNSSNLVSTSAKSGTFNATWTQDHRWIASTFDARFVHIGYYTFGQWSRDSWKVCHIFGERTIGPFDGRHGSVCCLGIAQTY